MYTRDVDTSRLRIRQVLVSKYTHKDWLFGAFTRPKRSMSMNSPKVILDDTADDSNPTKWWLLGMEKMILVVEVEVEEEMVKANFLVKRRKRIRNEKEMFI